MSHRLNFCPRRARPSRPEIERWLAGRAWWQLGAERASYYNPATGVYFGIDWLPEDAPSPLTFEIELFLSEFFVLEALPELSALVETFALDLAGPDEAYGPLDPERLLASWRHRNDRVCEARVDEIDAPHGTLSRAANVAVWKWNRSREAYGERLSTVEMVPCCPPPVRLAILHGDRSTVLTVTVWTGGAPIALPEVDLVLAAEAPDLAPRVIPQVALRPWLDAFPAARPAITSADRG